MFSLTPIGVKVVQENGKSVTILKEIKLEYIDKLFNELVI